VRWNRPIWGRHATIIVVGVVMRIVHDIRVRVWLDLWLVTIFVVVWNSWMLKD